MCFDWVFKESQENCRRFEFFILNFLTFLLSVQVSIIKSGLHFFVHFKTKSLIRFRYCGVNFEYELERFEIWLITVS
jgi:hypothetical protein